MEATSASLRVGIPRLSSEYLLPALDTSLRGFHRVSLVPGRAAAGPHDLLLDPNFCSLDDFGEPLGCTRMAVFHYTITLERIRSEPGQTLYAIAGAELPARLRLVVLHTLARVECAARLLVVDDDDHITQIIHLHATDHSAAAI